MCILLMMGDKNVHRDLQERSSITVKNKIEGRSTSAETSNRKAVPKPSKKVDRVRLASMSLRPIVRKVSTSFRLSSCYPVAPSEVPARLCAPALPSGCA